MEYKIIIRREFEDDFVTEMEFEQEPTKKEVFDNVMKIPLKNDDKFYEIEYWRVE